MWIAARSPIWTKASSARTARAAGRGLPTAACAIRAICVSAAGPAALRAAIRSSEALLSSVYRGPEAPVFLGIRLGIGRGGWTRQRDQLMDDHALWITLWPYMIDKCQVDST